jgi:hypothetical protein
MPRPFGLSATSQQYFSLGTNQPAATSQQYLYLTTDQHQPPAKRTGCKITTIRFGFYTHILICT